MSAITKERIELFIKNPLDNGLTRGEQMELARIALASLEAEPVGAFHIAEQQVDGTSDYLKDGEWPIDNGIIEVYAAPPVPVVPAALPENDDEDGHDTDYLEPSEVYALGRTAGWNACRAAMLKSFGNSEQLDEVGSWNNHRNTPTAQDGNHTEQNLDMVDHFGDATKKAMLHGSEPETDNTTQQFESLSRGDK